MTVGVRSKEFRITGICSLHNEDGMEPAAEIMALSWPACLSFHPSIMSKLFSFQELF
jgi:hypothetical protein